MLKNFNDWQLFYKMKIINVQLKTIVYDITRGNYKQSLKAQN